VEGLNELTGLRLRGMSVKSWIKELKRYENKTKEAGHIVGTEFAYTVVLRCYNCQCFE